MSLFKQKFDKIKNMQVKGLSRDFSFNGFSWFILALSIAGGMFVQVGFGPDVEVLQLVQVSGSIIGSAVILTLIPLWMILLMVIMGLLLGTLYAFGMDMILMAGVGSLGLMLSCSFQLVYQWDKVVVLRMGKIRRVHGPGLFLLLPLLDRIAAFVDTRIRATDFSAEKSLTQDTVPVHVDALCFWMIWDAQKAVLEVENYMEAVTLSAQTALRDSIGRHDLHTLLSERDVMGKEIQTALDSKTNPWGVSILSVEFTEIIIPQELEDSMSKQAQAERERKSRVILSEAEVEVAAQFKLAAEVYKKDPTALQLRSMNMVYDGLRQKKGSLMVLPSSALDQMNLGTVMGLQAHQEVEALQQSKENVNNKPEEGTK